MIRAILVERHRWCGVYIARRGDALMMAFGWITIVFMRESLLAALRKLRGIVTDGGDR